MKYLVYCVCSHSLELHGTEGCRGDRGSGCPCPLDQVEALNSAIDRARTDSSAALHVPEEEQISIA